MEAMVRPIEGVFKVQLMNLRSDMKVIFGTECINDSVYQVLTE